MDQIEATLLVIDDEEPVRSTIVAYLEDSGYNVIEASNGEEGLKKFFEHQPDLILCDLRMPRMDGLVVLERVIAHTTDVPFIVVSGAGVMNDVVDALKLGASDYLFKPVNDLAVLEHSVKRNLERSYLVKQNKKYREDLETTNRELTTHLDRLQMDMQAGRVVQQQLLPPKKLNISPLVFEHFMVPSMFLSGDFVDYFPISDDKFFFYIVDVSGHGASSAMITILIKSIINRFIEKQLQQGQCEIDLPGLIQTINVELLKSNTGKHATVFVSTLDAKENRLNYINAAHFPQPILFNYGEVSMIPTQGLAVGLFEDSKYEQKSVELSDDFELTLFSDGLLEVLTEKSLSEKEEYLLEKIGKEHNTISELAQTLKLEQVEDAPDDITLLQVKKG
ncbi:SpoIIE family protein phosphatase [Marinicellulosiphila megalodicopiae]|uniref:SpoIIE family protein phosphatase n=1 Tax=Marinicellulosiphila megalodicopiae TaxID=2724896 RepID=UPI003BAFD732